MKKSALQKKRCAARGFTLVELLVVVGIIAVLMGFIVAMVGAGKRAADSAKCSKVVSQLTAGWYLFCGDNDMLMPWSGEGGGNRNADWVFGGQNTGMLQDPGRWTADNFGFHAEAGAMFSHVTGLPLIKQQDGPNPGDRARYDPAHKTVYEEYRCPNSAEQEALAKAIRVNYSINTYIDFPRSNRTFTDFGDVPKTEYEDYLTNVQRPSEKILFVDEDSRSMKNASIHPGGSAARNSEYYGSFDSLFATHADKVNLSFIDGHVERWTQEKMNQAQNRGTHEGVSRYWLRKYWYPSAGLLLDEQ